MVAGTAPHTVVSMRTMAAKKKRDTVTRVVRFRLDVAALTPEQVVLMTRHVGCARQAWNWATARWRDYQRNVKDHVYRLAAKEACYQPGMVQPELGDALTVIALHAKGLTKEHKVWQNATYAEARSIHGSRDLFEDAYTLAALWRLSAESPEDPLHWWVSEGREARANGVARHGVSNFAYSTALADFAKCVAAYWNNPRYDRNGKRLGAPRFKKRTDDTGFAIMGLTHTGTDPWRVIQDGHRLLLPNLGSLRLTQNTRPLRRLIQRGGKPTSARFTRRGQRWFVAVSVSFDAGDAGIRPPTAPTRVQRSGGTVGVDLGVKALATLSTGEQIANPARLRANADRLRALDRQLDRQHRAGSPRCFDAKGRHRRGRCTWGDGDNPRSRRARTTGKQIADLHILLTEQRAGTLHELTKYLATHFEHVAIEDLKVSGMTRRPKPRPDPDNPGKFLRNKRRAKAGLNRAILDAGFGELRRQLTYKAERYGWEQ